MVGIVETDEARRRANELGLDLVEISPDARPPVCKIMDYGKFKYEEAKKQKAGKSKASELKEVRLGRSMKIDRHDVGIRVQQARRFLLEGHKVQLVASYKGREMAHREIGERLVNDVISRLLDLGKLEANPRLNGKRINAIISPDKHKIETWKRKEKAEGRKGVIEAVEIKDEPEDEGDDERVETVRLTAAAALAALALSPVDQQPPTANSCCAPLRFRLMQIRQETSLAGGSLGKWISRGPVSPVGARTGG